jgi:hypothetical protein
MAERVAEITTLGALSTSGIEWCSECGYVTRPAQERNTAFEGKATFRHWCKGGIGREGYELPEQGHNREEVVVQA